MEKKNKMCRNCENTSKPLSVKSDSASEYAISHIHSNIYDFSTIKEILNMKVPVTRVTREQLITY